MFHRTLLAGMQHSWLEVFSSLILYLLSALVLEHFNRASISLLS